MSSKGNEPLTSLAPVSLYIDLPQECTIQDKRIVVGHRIEHAGTHQVWLDIEINGSGYTILNGAWRDGFTNHDEVFTSTSNGAAKVSGRWRLHSDFSNWSFVNFWVSNKPSISTPANNAYVSRRPIITGTGGGNCSLKLIRADTGAALSNVFTATGDSWQVTPNQDLPAGHCTIAIEQSQTGYTTRRSNVRTLRVVQPIITSPIGNALLPEHEIVFQGDGWPGSSIHVVRADNHWAGLTAATVLTTNTWEAPLKPNVVLQSGTLTVEAQYQLTGMSHGYSPPLTFRVLGIPTITSPANNSLQNPIFTLSGSNGLAGAKVEVFKDLGDVKVGESDILTGANWAAQVTLEPGSYTLAASQSHSGKQTERSAYRTFKIRPPKLLVIVAYPDDKTVRFSGAGHTSATVQIWYKGGTGGVQWTAPVVNGSWEKEVTDWLPGSYVMSVRQSVPDGNTPIYSEWSDDVPVTVPVPKPTLNQPTDLPSQKPRFSGTGTTWPNQTATKVDVWLNDIAHAAVPQATVNGSSWSVTAIQEIAPGSYSVKARQLFGNKVSGWVELFGNMNRCQRSRASSMRRFLHGFSVRAGRGRWSRSPSATAPQSTWRR
jgi:hypothetical protein